MTAKMSRRVDPFIAYLVVAAKKALHDANLAEGSDEMCALSRARRVHHHLSDAC
jgi:3-oxoacyl-(acyl-carrier-protein) synthase